MFRDYAFPCTRRVPCDEESLSQSLRAESSGVRLARIGRRLVEPPGLSKGYRSQFDIEIVWDLIAPPKMAHNIFQIGELRRLAEIPNCARR